MSFWRPWENRNHVGGKHGSDRTSQGLGAWRRGRAGAVAPLVYRELCLLTRHFMPSEETQFDHARFAWILGLPRTTLISRMQKLGLSRCRGSMQEMIAQNAVGLQ
jgi:hypothetical protein